MADRRGMVPSKDDKFQPAKLSQRERDGQRKGNYNGDAHDFNIKGKVTKNYGAYADMSSGDGFNDSEKESSIAYLDNRGKKGQEVRNYSATKEWNKKTTQHSGTVYNNSPIPETYMPASSNGKPSANAVEYNTNSKNRGK